MAMSLPMMSNYAAPQSNLILNVNYGMAPAAPRQNPLESQALLAQNAMLC